MRLKSTSGLNCKGGVSNMNQPIRYNIDILKAFDGVISEHKFIERICIAEKISAKIERYQCERRETPTIILLDCFSVHALQRSYEDKFKLETICQNDKCKYLFNGIEIIPIETIEEFIHVQETDLGTLMGAAIRNQNKKCFNE